MKSASAGKRAAWILPVTLASCAAVVAAVGILIGVVGNAFGFFPTMPPDVTTEEGTVGDATEDSFEEITDDATNVPTEEDTDDRPQSAGGHHRPGDRPARG